MTKYEELLLAIQKDTNECIFIDCYIEEGGYPCLTANGERDRANRFVWRYLHGPIPPKLFVCHTCDVRACVNPKHLWLDTQAWNNQDMARKERGNKKLTAKQVREIRNAYGVGAWTQQELADEYGVTRSMICMIVRRSERKHIK